MKRRALALGVLVLLLGGGGWWWHRRTAERAEEERIVRATGTVEVTHGDVTCRVAGTLKWQKLAEGSRVAAGAPVAFVEVPQMEAQTRRDRAALERNRAVLADLEAGARGQELREARANVRAQEARTAHALADWKRMRTLFDEGVVAQADLDRVREVRDVTAGNLEAARQRLALLEAGTREQTLQAQRLEVKRAEAVVEIDEALQGDQTVRAPLSGVVLSRNREPGEYVVPGSVLATVGDLEDCWVRIYVASTQLGRVRLGQAARLKVDSYPDRTFRGKVTEIAQDAEFTPRQTLTQEERANLVFFVKVKIENPQGILKPGLPVDVELP